MNVASRTPEGEPHVCAICGKLVVTEPSEPLGDSVCPHCGSLLLELRDRLSRLAGIPIDQLSLDKNFTSDLGLDSLDTVELVLELEEEFDVQIPDGEAENLQTMRDAIRWILQRRNPLDPGDSPS